MKKIIIFLLSMAISNLANAGFNGITHHSRANCGNNESISWDFTHDWWFFTTSDHINIKTGELVHSITTFWQYTWRSAAVHWGEGISGWMVHGYHWMQTYTGQIVFVANEVVTDCSIYDGWWDVNK